MGVNSLKMSIFPVTYPLKSMSCSMSYLRTTVSVLEIVFVGQREVFVCLDFVLTFFFFLFFFSLGREAYRSANGASVL